MLVRLACVMGLLCGVSLPAAADPDPIGETTSARNEVTGSLGASVRTLSAGDAVSSNEVIQTGGGSAALFRFLDDSKLNVGASSTIVLDRFVYDPNRTGSEVVFNLTRGALRFVSGGSEPPGFMVKTPVGTLGIRGTDFVVICDESGRCALVVAEGKVRFCPQRDMPVDCPNAFDTDEKRNFSVVGKQGQHVGPLTISKELVAAVLAAVGTGDLLTVAGLESEVLGGGAVLAPRRASIELHRTPASPQ